MRYRTLGATGLRVSEVGFGTWGLGGAASGAVAYGPTQDAQSIAALHAARELGINFFDTADFYGFGHSEEVLAAAFGAVRGEVIIASKGGMLADGSQDFSPRHLRAALEGSLRRLRSEYVDLYQLHSPSLEAMRSDELRRELERFRAEGKVRAFGISARSPEDALAAVSELGFKCVQANFSLVDQRALECGLFEACRLARAAVIARTPLCFGFLTGRYSAATAFDPHDHRNRWSAEQRERWAAALGLFVTATASRPGETPAQFALRFCLSYPEVASVIPGMLTPEHVLENAAASNLGPLAAGEIAQIGAVYRQHSFFVGA
ncbi:MAG TPA: aldo/keto reductase [Burkholderiales bacterium]|nr:aldo/keto reductase [Burkholderiales bacterium]